MRYLLVILLLGGALHAADEPSKVTLTLGGDLAAPGFDPRQALGAGLDGYSEGETEGMYTPGSIRQMKRAGLGPVSVRLRTELAVEAWHWNPEGSWSNPVRRQGYWVSAAKPNPKAPILLSYGYKLPRRGNTLDEANDDGHSMLDDGDPATFWKSNPYLTSPYTGESDSRHPQWVVLDFGKPVPINSIRIQWAEPYAKRFEVEYATQGRVYFGGHPWNVWHTFPHGKLVHGTGGDQFLKLGEQPVKARYLRVWMTEGSGTSLHPASDRRDGLGYAIREISAGVCDAFSFDDQVVHTPGKGQTVTYASSTDPWHREIDRDPKVEQPGIDRIVRSGITRGLPLMLAVPVLYDTPENAAALASYVRSSGYPVSRHELGEEPDGQRIDPRDFGALYAETACMVRGVVPDAVMGGPSFVTADVDRNDDTYRFDHRWWIADFRRELSRRGQSGDLRFLSFEWYPFDDVLAPDERQLPSASGMLRRAMARLREFGLPLVIGECNYSVFPCRQEVDLGGALLNAETLAQFLCGGGEAVYYYGYEPNRLEQTSDSWGNHLMLLKKGASAVPVATFHAIRLITQEWLDPKGGLHRPVKVQSNLPRVENTPLGAFAVRRPDGTCSLLLINKDPARVFRLSLQRTGKTNPATPWRLATYSPREYRWHADEVDGYPARNVPPSVSTVSANQPILIPPWSVSVLRTE